jgi:hypothetical protein
VRVFWARRVHARETLSGVNFDFDDDAFKTHDGARVDACKHEGSVDEEGGKVNSWKKEFGS